MTRRGSRDCRHATLNRPRVQISHSGVAEQEHTDVQAAVQIGGSVRVISIAQATHVTGIRRARYLGLPETRPEHNVAAAAINLIRLDAWRTGQPLDRTRTTHLQRLHLALIIHADRSLASAGRQAM